MRTRPIISHILACTIAIVFYALITTPTPFKYESINEYNDCLVDALSFQSSIHVSARLHFSNIWSEVVCYTFTDVSNKPHGHAVCVFKYNGYYFVYDPNGGSYKLLDAVDLKDALARGIAFTLPDGCTLTGVADLILPE